MKDLAEQIDAALQRGRILGLKEAADLAFRMGNIDPKRDTSFDGGQRRMSKRIADKLDEMIEHAERTSS